MYITGSLRAVLAYTSNIIFWLYVIPHVLIYSNTSIKQDHLELKQHLSQGSLEFKPHLFPFMLPEAERTELSAMYQHVRKVMVHVHKGVEKVESLVHIADEW